MKFTQVLILLIAATSSVICQSSLQTPFISTLVSVDTLVFPDEITISYQISGKTEDFKKHKYDEKVKLILANIDSTLIKNFNLQNLNAYTSEFLFFDRNKNQHRNYKIKLVKPHQVVQLIDELQNIGIKEISVHEFNISNKTEILNKLRTKAVKKATEQAKALLVSTSQKLGKIFQSTTKNQIMACFQYYQAMSVRSSTN